MVHQLVWINEAPLRDRDLEGVDHMQASGRGLMLRTNDQDVVELLHSVDLGQKLVDHGVVHPRAAGPRSSLLADGIQLVKDDDVETTVGPQLQEEQGGEETDSVS